MMVPRDISSRRVVFVFQSIAKCLNGVRARGKDGNVVNAVPNLGTARVIVDSNSEDKRRATFTGWLSGPKCFRQ